VESQSRLFESPDAEGTEGHIFIVYEKYFKELVKRWHMCVAKNGDYFVEIILTEKLTESNSGSFVLSS